MSPSTRAAFHDRLAEVLKAALALTMWGAKVRLISTHNGVDNLFNELINDSRAGKKRFNVHRITLDDALGDGLYQRICQVSGQTWSQEAQDQWRENLLNGHRHQGRRPGGILLCAQVVRRQLPEPRTD